jgi:gliding motility-associated-like protein
MGGDITWTCQGGNYVFQLVFYRDCNGAVINTAFENLDVWGHPTISSIQLDFISSSDVSPLCTEVAGGPLALDCGVGQGGGNGVGAIEKAIYRSAPIALPGTPPVGGWVFTYQNFSRSTSVTNLTDPLTYGMTLTAKMFAIPNSPGGCVDNSPQFLQEPYFVSCVGDQYEYNMNAVDPDLDSLNISFGTALDHFPMQVWDPPNYPAAVPYEPGFSPTSPTPGPGMNAGNVAAQVDPSSGNLTFLTNNSGNFTVKIVAQSFRDGVLIAEVVREMQLIVVNCSGVNSAPSITGPFGGLFETTINAGDLVNFNLTSTDVELLQDGSPQDNMLSATGLMFGSNYTNPAAGCAIAPCATLDATPLIVAPQGVTTTFNWQTSCDHLVNPFGNEAAMIPYHFVFKVQDNYCSVPKVSYATVTINILNPGIVAAPVIDCIQTNATGDVTINWSPVADPAGTFTEYRVYSLQGGLLATIPNINTTTFTDPGVGQQNEYYIASASGCNGNSLKHSDTISNIYLDLNNPANGTALLQWNDPIDPALSGMGAYYHIYREYPAGTWTLYDSVSYGTHFYLDTIDICSVFLNYQIVLPNQPCDYTSNISGDDFEDMISPDIPILNFVTIDSLTNQVTISWNQNAQPDTYGYIIYVEIGGAIVELDQVFGIGTTTYTYSPDVSIGPLSYSVAAFDSCWTTTVPPTYQTSAKGEIHTTTFVTSSLNVCNRTVDLTWSDYVGWNDFDHYEIYGKSDSQPWGNFGATTASNFLVDVIEGETYTFVIQAISASGETSFSNSSTIFIETPGQPAFNYLQVATVVGEEVHLRHLIDASISVSEVSIQRLIDGQFQEIDRIPVTGNQLNYVDTDVDVNANTYTYRVQVIDSCGRPGEISNEARSILLSVDNDDVLKLNYLHWSPYQEFNGSIVGYNIYRGYDGIFTGGPIATLASSELYFTDDVNNVVSTGRVCYYVEALESMNVYSFAETSQSNERCITLPPLIYVPNAFMPGGINSIFIPVISDFDPTNYDFSIYDRLGQVIFQTNQPDEGWDGTIQLSGKMATNDTYVYMITLHDGDGIEIIKRGHVTLLK